MCYIDAPPDKPFLLERLLVSFHALSLFSGLLLTYFWQSALGGLCCGLSCMATLVTVIQISAKCPPCAVYGGVHNSKLTELVVESGVPLSNDSLASAFKMPMVPFLPCLAAFVNWYLVAQLDFAGLAMLVGYLGLVSLLFLMLHPKKVVPGPQYMVVNEDDKGKSYVQENVANDGGMVRVISMPRHSLLDSTSESATS